MMRRSLAVALLGAIGAFTGMDRAMMSIQQSAYAQPSRRQENKMRSQGSAWSYPAHDGHTVAQGKRLAAKSRNQRRHKRATKGK